jgi:hypothetical protein
VSPARAGAPPRPSPPDGRGARAWTRRRERRDAVREFLLAGRQLPPGAWVRATELPRAVLAYLRVGRRFRQRGLPAAVQLLPPVDARRAGLDPDDPATVFCARAAAVRLLGAGRTLGGRHLCLHESLALAAGLRRLGFPVQVLVGYPVIEPRSGENAGADLHAWPQLGQTAIADRLIGAPRHLVELVRYPGDYR